MRILLGSLFLLIIQNLPAQELLINDESADNEAWGGEISYNEGYNYPPVATIDSISGSFNPDSILIAYAHADDADGDSCWVNYQWKYADDSLGTGATILTGETDDSLTVPDSLNLKWVYVEPTPKALTGGRTGTTQTSYKNYVTTAEFSPLFYDPIAWYDASDASTIVITSGTVDTLKDKSGNGNTLTRVTQLTGGPTLTSNQLVFTRGSGKYLYRTAFTQGILAQPNTIFMLCEYTDSINTQFAMSSRSATNRNDFWVTSGQFRAYAGASNTNGSSDKQLNLHSCIFNGIPSVYTIDGVSVTATTGTQGMDGITLGAKYDNSSSAGVKINEIIIYDTILTDFQIDLLENYFIDKWTLGFLAYIEDDTIDNIYYKTGNVLYVVQKFDDLEDIITVFDKNLTNNNYTFYRQGFGNNGDETPDEDYTIDTTLMWARSDNIGPYSNRETSVSLIGGWSGGVHVYQSTIVDTVKYFNNTTHKLKITNDAVWPDSAVFFIETKGYFRYDTVLNDTLYGVALATAYPQYITTNDIVWLCWPTMDTSYISYENQDGNTLVESTWTNFETIKATATNKIYGYWTIDDTTGIGDTVISELIEYTVYSKGQINVYCRPKFVDDVYVSIYYGMQRARAENEFEDFIYIVDAQNSAIQTYQTGLNSGAWPTYPTDRVISYGNNLGHQIYLVVDSGLPTMGYGFTNYSFSIPSKQYFYQLDEGHQFTTDDTVYWSGSYTYFRNDLLENASYAYWQWEDGHRYFYADYHNAGTDELSDSWLIGKTVTIIEKSSTVSLIDDDTSDGIISINANGYGWIKLLIE